MTGTIRNRQGEKIDYTFHAGPQAAAPLVILGHGVTGNKDRPFVVELATALAAAGFNALRLSFSGNGASEGRFVDSTLSKEVDDLGAVLDAVGQPRVTYIGHSMGAAVGVLRASRDSRIQKLVSLAGMVHTADFARREFGTVQPGAGLMWDKPECPLSQAYMDDMNRIGSVVELSPQIRVPWLLVHGSADDVVPIQDSKDILAKAHPGTELVELPGVDHVFSDAGSAAMVQAVVQWMKR